MDEKAGETVQPDGGEERTKQSEEEPAQDANDGDDHDAQSKSAQLPTRLFLRSWWSGCRHPTRIPRGWVWVASAECREAYWRADDRQGSRPRAIRQVRPR